MDEKRGKVSSLEIIKVLNTQYGLVCLYKEPYCIHRRIDYGSPLLNCCSGCPSQRACKKGKEIAKEILAEREKNNEEE